MQSHNLITTDGSTLFKTSKLKPSLVLKTDLLNNPLWKSSKKVSAMNKVKKLDLFKTRFLKS